jgi:hypothetical protein
MFNADAWSTRCAIQELIGTRTHDSWLHLHAKWDLGPTWLEYSAFLSTRAVKRVQ